MELPTVSQARRVRRRQSARSTAPGLVADYISRIRVLNLVARLALKDAGERSLARKPSATTGQDGSLAMLFKSVDLDLT